jgi:hypothetical protein
MFSPSGIPTKLLYEFFIPPMRPANFILLDIKILTFAEAYKL